MKVIDKLKFLQKFVSSFTFYEFRFFVESYLVIILVTPVFSMYVTLTRFYLIFKRNHFSGTGI